MLIMEENDVEKKNSLSLVLKNSHFSNYFQQWKIILNEHEILNKKLFNYDFNIVFKNTRFPCIAKDLDVYNLWK